MAILLQKEVSTTGTTQWVPLDHTKNPFNVSVHAVKASAATATMSLELAFNKEESDIAADDVHTHPNMNAVTATSYVNLDKPATFARLNVSALSGGNVTLHIVQAGI